MGNNKIAIAREQQIFVVREASRGLLAAPIAAAYVIAAGFGSINQQPSFTNSKEIHNSRDIMDRFGDQTPPGSWSFPVYLRPSGEKGVEPQESLLMECLLGKKTINAGVSVIYAPAIEKQSFSYWVKKDHTVFWGAGCSVGTGKFALATKGGATVDLSGKFMRMGWAGTDETAEALTSGDTVVKVLDARKYSIGSLVEFELDNGAIYNNTDAGYAIIEKNSEAQTITVSALEADIASGSVVRGWLPVGAEKGDPLAARKGSAEIDGKGFKVQTMDFVINDDPKYLDDEITPSGYTEEFAEVQRDISGNLAIYFRRDDVGFFDDGLNNVEKALKMIVGKEEGSIVEVATPRTSISVPSISESDPTIALSTSIQALGTNGEDSVSITYK